MLRNDTASNKPSLNALDVLRNDSATLVIVRSLKALDELRNDSATNKQSSKVVLSLTDFNEKGEFIGHLAKRRTIKLKLLKMNWMRFRRKDYWSGK